jgi:type II secretory pathway pseudopilin PulG
MKPTPIKIAGFTLIELLIYLAIFFVISTVFLNSILVVSKVQVREGAETEVSSQSTFILGTIQRLIRSSSQVIVNNDSTNSCVSDKDGNNGDGTVGAPYPCLRLRMKDPSMDPTIVFMASSGHVKFKQGTGAVTNLTTSKVVSSLNSLTFTKFSNDPGHANVEINMTLNYRDQGNSSATLAKTLKSAVSRVSAANFDDNLLPGTLGNYDIGKLGTTWNHIFLGDGSTGNPSYTFGNDQTSGIFKGKNFWNEDVIGISTGGTMRFEIGLTNNNVGSTRDAYLKTWHTAGAGAPPAADCNGSDQQKGRIAWDAGTQRLFVCGNDTNANSNGWVRFTGVEL